MQEALLKIYKSRKVEVHHRKGGLGQGPFQKEINLKLGILNLFLMYSLLMMSGISIHQAKEEKNTRGFNVNEPIPNTDTEFFSS